MMIPWDLCQAAIITNTVEIVLVDLPNIMDITRLEVLHVCTITQTGNLYPTLYLQGKLLFQ